MRLRFVWLLCLVAGPCLALNKEYVDVIQLNSESTYYSSLSVKPYTFTRISPQLTLSANAQISVELTLNYLSKTHSQQMLSDSSISKLADVRANLDEKIPNFQNNGSDVVYLNIYSLDQLSSTSVTVSEILGSTDAYRVDALALPAVKRMEIILPLPQSDSSDGPEVTVELKQKLYWSDSYYIVLATPWSSLYSISYSYKLSFWNEDGSHLSWEDKSILIVEPFILTAFLLACIWWSWQYFYLDSPDITSSKRWQQLKNADNSGAIRVSGHSDAGSLKISPVPALLFSVLVFFSFGYVLDIAFLSVANLTGNEVMGLRSAGSLMMLAGECLFITYACYSAVGWSVIEYQLDNKEFALSFLSVLLYAVLGVAREAVASDLAKALFQLTMEFYRFVLAFLINLVFYATLMKYRSYISGKHPDNMNRNRAMHLLNNYRKYLHMTSIVSLIPIILVSSIVVLFLYSFVLNQAYYWIAFTALQLIWLTVLCLILADTIPVALDITPANISSQPPTQPNSVNNSIVNLSTELAQSDEVLKKKQAKQRFFVPSLFIEPDWLPGDLQRRDDRNNARPFFGGILNFRSRRATHPDPRPVA